ncbi:esterase/lipase family protein [Photobacterium lutimaris]|uniref:DUF676 domain-containing protein n=1 Tax=Photobacterium lutimaris TaxID=388278 RepID=A0A2T3IIB1_9GAMM|nr:alpha/beta hydrolase [Photobacterium lutimaris]PSU28079.1 hypothetical protein C9I99_26440 [Photobacterium lutimaris]TDR70175.1 hypothetical protein DFP78_12417 [Photobacterium lutimaris]
MDKRLLFVHGFYGGKDTWGKFPELMQEVVECEVSEYGYDSCYLPFFGNTTSVHNLAEGLLTEIKANKLFEADELILVGHSLGGLVIRQLLLNLELKQLSHNISKVAFFAVPQDGSGFANILSKLPIRCQKLKALNKDGDFVEQLNDSWSYAKLNEKYQFLSVVGGKDAIVKTNSSKSIFRDHIVETNTRANHRDIVKPKSEEDLSFKLLVDFVNSKKKLNKYKNRASKSYDDWLKIDRHHNLKYVQDENRESAFQALCDGLKSSKKLVRLTGLSGLGKSRLLIEYIKHHKIDNDYILIYDMTRGEEDIEDSIQKAVNENVVGLAIIENCSISLHERINKMLSHDECQLKVVTVNYYHEFVHDSIHIKLEKLDSKKVKELIQSRLSNLNSQTIERLERFVEGFPLLADMVTKQLISDGKVSSTFTESDLIKKLIDGNGSLTNNQYELLKVFSLFDVFKFSKKHNEDANGDAEFINQIAGTSQKEFESTITSFSQKEIVNCVGRYARVVPKPLSLNLAMEWWNESLYDRQSDLISKLPASLLDSFCSQIKYLDSSINVQSFVENFCSEARPFGQAELLLSSKGSRLFRALVEINPAATSRAIYRITNQLSDSEIDDIRGDTRRNLIWSLEMLVFHEECFDEAAWCLFKLAQNENESYSNNATGQFIQLFRWQLSGTEANFEQRLRLLEKALIINQESSDKVIIQALSSALSTGGGSRTVGAEYQGTKPEMSEWTPSIWQEIYDYWKTCIAILLKLSKKDNILDNVKNILGRKIRNFALIGQAQLLNDAVKDIISYSGKYWPDADQSISDALQYDSSKVDKKQIVILKSWQHLLSPDLDNIEEQLKSIVLNPSRDHDINSDGEIIDHAANSAKDFAKRIAYNKMKLENHLNLIFNFTEQKQTFLFARDIVLNSDYCPEFENILINFLIKNKVKSVQFLKGYFYGLYKISPEKWHNSLAKFSEIDELKIYYPEVMCTGEFDKKQLEKLLSLFLNKEISSHYAYVLSYGGAVDHLSESIISNFCSEYSKIDNVSCWISLNILNMYMFGNKEYDIKQIEETLKEIVLNVSFGKDNKNWHTDSYHWYESVKKLLTHSDDDFAISLCRSLVEHVSNHEVDFSDLWDYLHPAFYKAFQQHGNVIWPQVSEQIKNSQGLKRYRLIDLIGSGKESRKKSNSIFTLLDVKDVISWCQDEDSLLIVARTLSIFEKSEDQRFITPLLIKLIEEFGTNQKLLSEISANYHSRSWSGSLVPYLEDDLNVISPFKSHSNPSVQIWAIDFCKMIESEIASEQESDQEESMWRGHN